MKIRRLTRMRWPRYEESRGSVRPMRCARPFLLGDRTALAALFESAGLPSMEISMLKDRARFPSIKAMVEADLRGWLPAMGVDLAEDQIQHILAEAQSALGRFVTSKGEVEFEAPAHVIVCTKP